jgi:hypothetical protein
MAYIGIKSCGCVVGAIADARIAGEDFVKRALSDFRSRGYQIKEVGLDEANKTVKGCVHRVLKDNPAYGKEFEYLRKK